MGATVTPEPAPTAARPGPGGVAARRRQGLRADPGAARRHARAPRRRGHVPRRRERGRQEHADQDPHRRHPARRRRVPDRRPGGRQPEPRRGARGRHRRRLPGAQPAARPVGRRRTCSWATCPPCAGSPAPASCAASRGRCSSASAWTGWTPTPRSTRCRWPSASWWRSPRCSAPTRACSSSTSRRRPCRRARPRRCWPASTRCATRATRSCTSAITSRRCSRSAIA